VKNMATSPEQNPRAEVMEVVRQVSRIVRGTLGDPAYRVFLYGSWAAGEAGDRSDIDIGIEGGSPVPPEAMAAIREACDALPTLYTIEIVDFVRVPPGFRRVAQARILEQEAA
jgi:predicted nucleotidyltransferase